MTPNHVVEFRVCFNTLRPRQNGRHFADDTFKRIFMNENVRISINISLKFVPKGLINNTPAWSAPSHYLNQWWLIHWLTYASLGFNELTYFSVVVCLGCLLHHILSYHCIYIPGKLGFCFHYYCAVYDECKYSDTFWLAVRIRVIVHYTISLSSLCQLIWGHWTYKMPVRYILWSVWVILNIFSQLSIIQYMALCVFSLPISLVIIERI